jgi:hypothetical protein
MARFHLVLSVLMAAAAAACGAVPQTPVVPTAAVPSATSAGSPAPPAVPGPCVVGFEGLQIHGAVFDRHAACGLTITAASAEWQASTTYGNPPPFIQFLAPGGTTLTGDLVLQSTDGAFMFTAVDSYSSTTKIPYEITGSAHGAVAFTLAAVQSNTFGGFATIVNPHGTNPIDTLRLSLTNPAAPCCTNPVGVDNIRIVR